MPGLGVKGLHILDGTAAEPPWGRFGFFLEWFESAQSVPKSTGSWGRIRVKGFEFSVVCLGFELRSLFGNVLKR